MTKIERGARFPGNPLTPPSMRVRTRRFDEAEQVPPRDSLSSTSLEAPTIGWSKTSELPCDRKIECESR